MTKKNNRFSDWEYPDVNEGSLTKYNWVVQNIEGFELGYKTDIGSFTYINAKCGVVIADNVQIGSHCAIYSISTIDDTYGKIVFETNSRLGSHSTVLPGVTVGENSIIGAHSLVKTNIPSGVVAYGVPAKIIKLLDE
jgi:acetyltransferase-like isoleucine patch superfamily enzyme